MITQGKSHHLKVSGRWISAPIQMLDGGERNEPAHPVHGWVSSLPAAQRCAGQSCLASAEYKCVSVLRCWGDNDSDLFLENLKDTVTGRHWLFKREEASFPVTGQTTPINGFKGGHVGPTE